MSSEDKIVEIVKALSQEEVYNKALFQLKGQLDVIMTPLKKYGQQPYVDEAINQIVKVVVQFHHRLNGKDVPIYVEVRRADSKTM